MTKKNNTRVKIGISVGDLNGVGMEVILKTLSDNRICELCSPVIFGSKGVCDFYIKQLQINNINLNYITSLEQIKLKQPSVITVWKDKLNLSPGMEDKQSGKYAYQSLEAVVTALKEGLIDAMVTAPINKELIQSEEFNFPGHTEYLQAKDEAEDSLMLMLSENTRIGVATGHIPLEKVKASLSTDLILKKITLLNKSLKEDFGIRKPKIAVLALNPHAGDKGLLGDDEEKIITPAINQAKSIGVFAFGPFAADGFFGSANYLNFDGVLAMYHDQGLIPAKTFSFGEGVNFTAGLSFVRTSPDHGTAYEIAGKGIAQEASFRNALYRAIEIAQKRKEQQVLESNVLEVNKSRN
jgi:4-hydroxythreonine-4-phosphate dehydrogenase